MDAHSKDLEEFLSAECAVLSPIFHLIDMLHDKYFETRPKPTERCQAVEVIATAVNPIYYNKGLLNIMCHHSFLNIIQKHKDGIVILLEPTGAFSQVKLDLLRILKKSFWISDSEQLFYIGRWN